MAKQLSALTRQAMAHPPLRAIEREWIGKYESETGFEPMHLDELMRNEMTFAEMARINVDWFENWMNDAFLHISAVPEAWQ